MHTVAGDGLWHPFLRLMPLSVTGCLQYVRRDGRAFFQLTGLIEAAGAGRQHPVVCTNQFARCQLPGLQLADNAAGVKERKCWLNVARMCLYDGARFHGNVQVSRAAPVFILYYRSCRNCN